MPFVLPRLYAILDVDVAEAGGWTPRDLWRAFLTGGARLLQLRAKHLASGPLLDLASELVEDAREAGAVVILNDRADLALLARADGVHVGQDDLPVPDVRRLVGSETIVGVSTHTEAQVSAALTWPVSYLAVGPVFGTGTKDTGYRPVGTEFVRAAAALVPDEIPLVAIGGITLERAPEVLAAGARAVAVITDLMIGAPEARVRDWVARLG